MSDPSLGLTGLEGGEAGQPKSRHFGDIKARFKVDDQGLKDLNTHFVKLNENTKSFQGRLRGLTEGTKRWADELKRVADYMKQIGPGAGATGGGGGGGVYSPGGPLASFADRTATGPSPLPGGAGGGGGGGGNMIDRWRGAQDAFGATKGGMYAQAALAIVGSGVQAMDNRIQGAAAGVHSADQIGLMFRQMSPGMSTLQYSSYRQGLANYRLGDPNSLLNLEARTGISAMQQAGSIDMLRQATGFQMSTEQGARMVESLAGPGVNNRMTMMLGTGLIGPGGQTRPMEQVVQDIIQRTGLSNPAVARSARTPGSNTRAMLAQSGVPEDMIDMIIMRANQQGPGGQALNPEANNTSLAGAQADLERTTQQREEGFYREQVDNYEKLAERTKALVGLFKELEDVLGGIIGTGVSTSVARKYGGAIGTGMGAVIGGIAGSIIPGAGTVAGAAVGSMIGGSIGNAIGDAVPAGGGSGPTTNAGGATPVTPKNLQGAVNTETWQKMHGNMKQRLLRMFKDNPALSFGNGYRSPALQRSMFLERHRVDPNGNITFEGKKWRRLPGFPPTAAPGRSMHEIGLAADLGPKSQYGWIVANAAKYGLQVGTSFGEPWHVQPAELPMSRTRYEKAGAAWGTTPGAAGGSEDYQQSASGVDGPDTLEAEGAPELEPGGGRGITMFDANASIAEVIQAQFDANRGLVSAGGGLSSNTGGSVSSGPSQASAISNAGGSDAFKPGSSGALTGEQVAKLVAGKGIRGDAMAKAIAIAYGESRFNPGATGDVSLQNAKWGPSLGLWQVRSVNAERGKGTSRDATRLKDPQFNANSMYEISGGGNNWRPWSVFTSGAYAQHMNAAKTSMQNAGVAGDAIADPPVGGGGGSSSVSVRGGATITIAPQITIQGGSGSRADAARIAAEVIRIIQTSDALKSLRSS